MRKIKLAILAIGLLLGTSAFADTYQWTVNFTGGPIGDSSMVFTTNYLNPPGANTFVANQADLSAILSQTPPSGFFLAQVLTSPPNCCGSGAFVDVVWDLNTNTNDFVEERLTVGGGGTFVLGNNSVGGLYFSHDRGDGSLSGSVEIEDVTTPEPASLALLGSGFIGLAGTLRRKFLN